MQMDFKKIQIKRKTVLFIVLFVLAVGIVIFICGQSISIPIQCQMTFYSLNGNTFTASLQMEVIHTAFHSLQYCGNIVIGNQHYLSWDQVFHNAKKDKFDGIKEKYNGVIYPYFYLEDDKFSKKIFLELFYDCERNVYLAYCVWFYDGEAVIYYGSSNPMDNKDTIYDRICTGFMGESHKILYFSPYHIKEIVKYYS